MACDNVYSCINVSGEHAVYVFTVEVYRARNQLGFSVGFKENFHLDPNDGRWSGGEGKMGTAPGY
jgi:hypothetical protein